MIGKEDIFYAFFAGIASLVSAFLIVYLISPNQFQNNPSILSIALIVAIEIIVFFSFFFAMRRYS
jgi:ABC-type antimicrobial peptide transport system permease subunit